MIYKIKPFLAYRLWGGDKLPQSFYCCINDHIGEAWSLTCVKDKDCFVSSRKTLSSLFKENPNIVAKGWDKPFPILIKLIDAKQDLSIQVHPSFKTEFWHVLNDKPSSLYVGFKEDTTKQEIEDVLKNGDITKKLNKVEIKKGDSYLIPAGTVHAINAGTFLIEIQQSADCTYRLYDYHRKEPNGKERDLHIDKALECIDYKQYKSTKGKDKEHLVSCPYFNVYKHEIIREQTFNADDKSFHAITIVKGQGLVTTANQEVAVKPYDTIFIPASEGEYKVDGSLTIIRTTL